MLLHQPNPSGSLPPAMRGQHKPGAVSVGAGNMAAHHPALGIKAIRAESRSMLWNWRG